MREFLAGCVKSVEKHILYSYCFTAIAPSKRQWRYGCAKRIYDMSTEITKGKVQVGDKAPDFTLPSATGEKVSLSSFLGKKYVVLYFYPKDCCTPVKMGV